MKHFFPTRMPLIFHRYMICDPMSVSHPIHQAPRGQSRVLTRVDAHPPDSPWWLGFPRLSHHGPMVMGVPLVIIHFGLGCSMK